MDAMSNSRGFPVSEFQTRTVEAQALMAEAGLGALLLTTEVEIRYYTGFLTRFWESPTRPWFVIIPLSGMPVAVIPSIGEALMAKSWISDIRTWHSPDYTDDGVGLLAETLCELTSPTSLVGVATHAETYLRMPLGDFYDLNQRLESRTIVPDQGITARLRLTKSPLEVAKIETACQIANRAFDRVPERAKSGCGLDHVFRAFQSLCLDEGADWVSYLAGAAAQGGYSDVISPATSEPLTDGDVLMLDTGLVFDGYFCDFDRNYSVGAPTPEVQSAHQRLIAATQAGFEAARPGVRMSDVFNAMEAVLTCGHKVGRLGHGLGMQLTEGPSILPDDHTPLQSGMVLTLEPLIPVSEGKMMVHEENIVIEETGARYLSAPQGDEIRRV